MNSILIIIDERSLAWSSKSVTNCANNCVDAVSIEQRKSYLIFS